MKKALIIIIALIALLLVVSALLPSTASVERSETINAPVSIVFDQVSDLEKNWNWSPWIEQDPEMQIDYGQIRSGLGASYGWSGNNEVGKGTLKVVEWNENEFIKNDLVFDGMDPAQGSWVFETILIDNDAGESIEGTKVTWRIDSRLAWPVWRFFGLFMDGIVGPNFERGLENLKEVSESIPLVPKLKVELTNVLAMDYLSIKDSIPMAEIGSNMGKMYGEIITVMEANEIEVHTSPICFYHEWNEAEGYTVMEAAIVLDVEADIELSGRVTKGSSVAGPAAKVVYMGNYDDLGRAHYAIDEWMQDNEREIGGSPWEMYVTDPGVEPDTSKWITEIFYPLL